MGRNQFDALVQRVYATLPMDEGDEKNDVINYRLRQLELHRNKLLSIAKNNPALSASEANERALDVE